jgi:Divergent InlB B-repeat domain
MMYRVVGVLVLVASCGEVAPLGDGGPGQPQRLMVSVTGTGTVTSMPAGIDCGAACSADFDGGASVVLTANPAVNAAFVGWSGDCAGSAPCTVTMDAAKSVMATFAAHGSKRWVAQVSFAGQDSMEELVVAPDGNLIAAGTVDDGNGTDLFVVKYAKEDGHVVWMQKIDTGFGSNFGGLALDDAGNVYLAARLLGDGTTPVMIGTTPVVGDLFGNVIVMRLGAANGAVVWVKQWGGDGQDFPKAVVVSGNDVYVAGTTSSNPSVFDGKQLAATGTGQGFIVRAASANGTAAELKHIPATVDPTGIAVNGTHIAVAGRIRQAVTLDRCGMTPSGAGADAMIIDLLGSTLVCQWARNFGDFVNNNDAAFQAIAAFPGGGWAVSGDFKGNVNIAGTGPSLSSRGDFDVLAARFAGDGTHVWSFRYGDTGFDLGEGIAVTPEGNVLLAGTFNTSITFGLTTVNGVMNSFVTRMSAGATPTHEWAVSLGGDSYDLTQGTTTAPDGTVYIAGLFTGMTNIGGTLLTAQDYDTWIVALVK